MRKYYIDVTTCLDREIVLKGLVREERIRLKLVLNV